MDRNEQIQALTITRLSIRLTVAALEMYTDDVETLQIMVSGNDQAVSALRIHTEGDLLTVEQPASSLARGPIGSCWMQVTLRIPRTWKGTIEARTVSGWISARSLSGADLTVDTVSGKITLIDMAFLTISARSVASDVKLNGVQCGKCSLMSTTGSVTVAEGDVRTLSGTTVTGVITLGLLTPFEEISLNSVSGDLGIDAPVDSCDVVLRSVSGRTRTSGVSIVEGAAKVRANTVTSDLDISRSDAPMA